MRGYHGLPVGRQQRSGKGGVTQICAVQVSLA